MRATWWLLAALLGPALAHADEPATPEATALFERGRDLVKAGKHDEACPLFQRSFDLAPALGTELNLARCLAATSKLIEARDLFQRLIPKCQEANQPQRETIAREGLADVVSRLPRLQIVLGALPSSTEVRVDGHAVEAGAPVMVDPGEHRIEADGASPVAVTVVEQDLTRVQLEPVAETPEPPERVRPPIVWALGGAAAGSLFIGTLTGAAVIKIKNAGLRRCDRSTGELVCDERGAELLDHARAWSHVTTVLFVAGLGLAAATVVMEMRSRRTDRPVATAWVSPSAAGLAVGGRW